MKFLSLVLLAISLAAPLSPAVASGAAGSGCDPASLDGPTVLHAGIGQPSERVVIDNLADGASSGAEQDAETANYTACIRRRPWYPIPDILPATGVPLVTVGLFGCGLMAAGFTLSMVRLRGQRRSA